jgi:hypothetical protein
MVRFKISAYLSEENRWPQPWNDLAHVMVHGPPADLHLTLTNTVHLRLQLRSVTTATANRESRQNGYLEAQPGRYERWRNLQQATATE